MMLRNSKIVLFGFVVLIAAGCNKSVPPSIPILTANPVVPTIPKVEANPDIGSQAPNQGSESLTREEKIKKIEDELLKSLNNFGSCHPDDPAAVSGGGGSGGGSAGGGGLQGTQGTEGQAGAQGVVESAPAGDIQGDLPASQASADGQVGGTGEITTTDSADPGNSGSISSNGKLPEDIPPAENDDIIAKQFRRAALDESDPAARAKLWNEYRRYKNLPVQEVPES